MRSQRVASPGKARWFRQLRSCGIGVCVVTRQQRFATGLTCHAHISDEIILCCPCDAIRSDAAVPVPVENAPFVVGCDFVEIEKIAIGLTPALLPYASHALNGIIWSRVDRRPGSPLVVSGGDECIPFAWESDGLVITVYISSEETHCRTA